MRFGKFYFKDYKEFQHISSLAAISGAETLEEFFKFLSANCSDKIVKK